MSRGQPHRGPAPLPVQLRVARVAELLYLPVVLLAAVGLPLGGGPGRALALLMVLLQAALVVVLFFKLGRGSRVAWIVAMVLAAYVLLNFVVQARRLFAGGAWMLGVVPAALTAWGLLMQLVVLGACLSLLPRRAELR